MAVRLQKNLLPLAALLLAAGVSAQSPLKRFDLFDKSDCGVNPNDLDVLSSTIEVFEKAQAEPGTGKLTGGCRSATIDYKEWPRTGNEYDVWIDAGSIDAGCQLIFYNVSEDDDDWQQGLSCWQPYRRVTSKSECGWLSLPQRFGYAYCCDNGCKAIPGTLGKRAPAADVTAIKRKAPPVLQTRAECKFRPSDGSRVTYTYGPQVKVAPERKCPAEAEVADCTWKYKYTVGRTVTDSTGVSASMGVAWEVLQASMSIETYHEVQEQKTFENEKSVSFRPGTEGYPAFMPKLQCRKGKLEGDCGGAENKGEDTYCIPSLVGREADGKWSPVYIN